MPGLASASRAASARRSPSARLYSSVPRSSQLPSMSSLSFGLAVKRRGHGGDVRLFACLDHRAVKREMNRVSRQRRAVLDHACPEFVDVGGGAAAGLGVSTPGAGFITGLCRAFGNVRLPLSSPTIGVCDPGIGVTFVRSVFAARGGQRRGQREHQRENQSGSFS